MDLAKKAALRRIRLRSKMPRLNKTRAVEECLDRAFQKVHPKPRQVARRGRNRAQ